VKPLPIETEHAGRNLILEVHGGLVYVGHAHAIQSIYSEARAIIVEPDRLIIHLTLPTNARVRASQAASQIAPAFASGDLAAMYT